MDTPTGHLDTPSIARLLVLLQGAVLVTATIESASFVSVIGPGAGPGVVLSAAAALLTLLSAWGLGRRSRLARRWTIVAECGVLALAGLDLVVGIVFGGVELTALGVALRVGVPLAVLTILLGRDGRGAFATSGGVA